MKLNREQKQTVDFEAFEAIRKERDELLAERDALNKRIEELKNDVVAHSKKIEELRHNNNELRALLDDVRKDRKSFYDQFKTAARANDSLMEEIKQLKAQGTEAHGQFQKRVEELKDGLDASAVLLKTAQDERDVARREADYLRADYDARGKVIKKLRKRLHKLKKKLKH